MSATDISILIPARNEMFLARTVEDLLENIEADTEILVGLDGQWAEPPIPQHPKVTVVYYPESIGQRAMTNRLCKLSRAKYVIKTDAHCSFDKGFDKKLLQDMNDNWTVVPAMKNLHAFDWVCDACNFREYQGKSHPCPKCGSSMHREMVWKPRKGVTSYFYRFDKTLHFQYWSDFNNRPEANSDMPPSMSIQGSFFMLTRDKYWELNICDENHGSWGQQGVEVACKTWLSGGEVRINKKTWYAHMFRTQGGDFGFPYPNPGSAVEKARKYSRDLWFNNKWEKAIHPLSWLIDKFAPVPGWDNTKTILYYTDNELQEDIAQRVRKCIRAATLGDQIVSVALKKSVEWDANDVTSWYYPGDRGYLTMAKQILHGLQNSEGDIVFFTEHDVLYHPSHFDFIPPREDVFYYNTNVYKTRFEDGFSVKVDDCRQLSGLCAYRSVLLKHYEKRVKLLEDFLEKNKDNPNKDEDFKRYVRAMGFEPGTHNRKERVDDLKSSTWQSEMPNVDIRHNKNLTPNRWGKDQFRNERYTKGWTETFDIPGWGNFKDFFYKI